jgi:hypothetical protein
MRKLISVLALALCCVTGQLAVAGPVHAFSHCTDHSYPPGTTVNGCGTYAGGCPGTCGFTMSGQTYYYHTCESPWPSSCTEDSPLVVPIKMDAGYCFGTGGGTCDCGSAGGGMSGYISLPQCH